MKQQSARTVNTTFKFKKVPFFKTEINFLGYDYTFLAEKLF